jgi:hypothetical protein
MGAGFGSEIHIVLDSIELNVGLDHFRKVDGVSRFARVDHDCLIVEDTRLVFPLLHHDDRPGRGRIRGGQNEIFTLDCD